MKADERSAADRNPRWRAGHHVMVAGAVVPLVVADRADDGQLVGDAGQPGHVLREVHAGDLGLDRRELAADLGRRVGLGIERLEVRRPAIHPDQDATGRALGRRRLSAGQRSHPQQVHEAAARRHGQTRASGNRGATCRHSWYAKPFPISSAVCRLALILEHKLGRVHQRPQQIFGRLPPIGIGGKGLRSRPAVPRRWEIGCRRSDTTRRRSPAAACRLPRAGPRGPCRWRTFLCKSGAFIRCKACTIVESGARS